MKSRILNRASAAAMALAVTAVPGIGAAQNLYVAGPLERVDASRSKLIVLGQEVAVDRVQLSQVLNASRDAAGSQVQLIAAGPSLRGRIVARTLIIQESPYVSGASVVALLGYVSKVDQSTGRASIGGLTIDVSAVGPRIALGNLVEVGGTQPNPRGALVASEFRFGTAGSIGTGTAGSIGTGTAGSIGTGTAGSIGTGTAGSIGTGTAGSIGTGTAGSIGTGTAGSIGTGSR